MNSFFSLKNYRKINIYNKKNILKCIKKDVLTVYLSMNKNKNIYNEDLTLLYNKTNLIIHHTKIDGYS